MAYIELHQALFDHRKTIIAAEQLGMPEVHLVGHLAALWSWCLDNCPDGILPESQRAVARGARWEGDPQSLIGALVSGDFIEHTEAGLKIHDWEQYGGKLIEKRRANAEKQARYRDRLDTKPSPKADVTVTLPSRDDPEKSREEKTRVDPSGTPPVVPQAPPKPTPVKTEPKPRTEKQKASDELYERKMVLVSAYFRGLEIQEGTLPWNQRKNVALGALTPVILQSPECVPEIIEPLTRYTASAFKWRFGNQIPKLAEVLMAFAEWDQLGRPEQVDRQARAPTPIRQSNHNGRVPLTRDQMLAIGNGESVEHSRNR